MARPSIKDQRKEEILTAYEVCIGKYGVEGATLNKVAEEANIARPLLRHNVGNRDELLKQALDRFVSNSLNEMKEAYTYFKGNPEGLFQSLFEREISLEDENRVMIASAFIIASQTNSTVKDRVHKWLSQYRDEFNSYFISEYPKLDSEATSHVTDGIMGIYFNVHSLVHLGNLELFHKSSYEGAKILFKQLQGDV
jgi:AcrR family transcriptional regulator